METDLSSNRTFNSPPKPIGTSSVKSNRLRKITNTEQSDTDNSLGLISITSDDLDLVPERMTDISKELRDIRQEAQKTMSRASLHSGLPSRFLRPSEVSKSIASTRINATESTINESDLFSTNNFTDTSTPRGSYSDDVPRRQSTIGQSMAQLSSALLNNNTMSLEKFTEEFRKTMNISADFIPGEEMEKQFMEDEHSWCNKNELPVEKNNFTLNSTVDKVSIGSFFQKRSDDLLNLLAKSPLKQHKPKPLIESDNSLEFTETFDEFKNDAATNIESSISVSDIAKILSETDNTPQKVLDVLMRKQIKKPSGKENIEHLSPKNQSPERCSNLRDKSHIYTCGSASSLSQLPNGKLPIESSRVQLVWGCVKIGKIASQDFILRNKSNNKLKIQCSVSNLSFKIKDRSDLESTIKLIMYPHESRTITINFIPNNIGAAVDELLFTSLDPHHRQTRKQCIKLFGYGGCTNVSVINTFKDLSGRLLLSLGDIIKDSEVTQQFVIKNTGTLPAFALCNFTSKGFSQLEINSKKVVLLPKEEKEVTVTYTPSKDDLKFFKTTTTAVIDIGVIQLITGPEAIRGRIRKLYRKAMEKELEIDPLVEKLQETFPGEIIPNDLKLINELPNNVNDLLANLTRQEITIILEQDQNTTIVNEFDDETVFFQTLDGANATQFLDTTVVKKNNCRVEPSNIILTCNKLEDFIFITSLSVKNLNFRVQGDLDVLEFEPNSGIISVGETVGVSVKVNRSCTSNVFQVIVYVDNEPYVVEVKLLSIGPTKGI